MRTIFFSSNIDTIDEWKRRDDSSVIEICYDADSLNQESLKNDDFILIVDYDSVAGELNRLISSNALPKNVIVLEKIPEIATGKMLISHKVKAYGNSRMLKTHYVKMIQSVKNGKIWTYPKLTMALVNVSPGIALNEDSKSLIENRLTAKEREVVYLVLEGLTNDAIASKLEITSRTVKSHMSAIFTKLRINDRVSLILLLK